MRSAFGNSEIVAREIGGHFRPERDKIVTRHFGKVAKVRWPEKTSWHVAILCSCDERQAKRYISGEYPVPWIMLRSMCDWMLGNEQ